MITNNNFFDRIIRHSRSPFIYHGAMVDEDGNETLDVNALNHFNKISNKPLAVVYFTDKWALNPTLEFPTEKCMIAYRGGSIPFIRIQNSEDPDGAPGTMGKFSHSNIIAGKWDEQLKLYAQAASRFPSPIIIEYGTEIDGKWFCWSDEGPALFKEAYHHIVKIFRDNTITAVNNNIEFAFHCDITNDDTNHATPLWYPGDDVCSWVGTSCYGYSGSKKKSSPGCVFTLEKYYDKLQALTKTAKLGVFEWGLGDPIDTKNTLELLPRKFPKIKLLQLWNERVVPGHENDDDLPDSRIDVSFDNIREYQKGISNSVYKSKYK